MNHKEISEIRRRLRPDKNNIGRIRGCYVNSNRTIISEFDQNLGLISNDESEEILSIFRKIYSGAIGRNLIDISFTSDQVLNSEEHELLSILRNTCLSDNEAVKVFYNLIINSIDIDGNYLIMLANDKYDIYSYSENGEKSDSSEMFSYIMCAISPIKATKPTLAYNLAENKFKNIIRDSMICAPEIGFMFPVYESHGANIYNALYYTRDVSNSHKEFTDCIFKVDTPIPAAEQTANIADILSETMAESCNLELIQSIHGQLIELTSDHKANKEDVPLLLSAKDIGSLLRYGGVSQKDVDDFSQRFQSNMGESINIPPSNVMNIKTFEVKTPEVKIKVNPEHSDLLETRIIDGTKYLLIRADGDVEVNGIRINFTDKE